MAITVLNGNSFLHGSARAYRSDSWENAMSWGFLVDYILTFIFFALVMAGLAALIIVLKMLPDWAMFAILNGVLTFIFIKLRRE